MVDLLFLMLPLAIWLIWFARIADVTRLASSWADRLPMYATPVACLLGLGLWFALGETESRNRPVLFWFAALVFAIASSQISWLGLSPRDDVAERRNRSAGLAISGAIIGLTLAIAGAMTPIPGPIRGPTDILYELAAAVRGVTAVLIFAFLWGILDAVARPAEAITVDRDGGAALRLAAFLVSLGLAVGRAASAPTRPVGLSLVFAVFAPIALLLVALAVESLKCRRPRFGRPRTLDVILAIGYLTWAGCWTCLST